MISKNEEIRREARIACVPLWRIAVELGYTDSYFSKMLRKEMSNVDRERVLAIIKRLREDDAV